MYHRSLIYFHPQMELIDHSALGFIQDSGGSTPPPRQVSDLSSQDSYGGYEEAEHHLRNLEMWKTPSSKDFRGNIDGLVQASSNGSSLLSFQGKNDGASSFARRDQEDVGCYERIEGDFGSLLRGNVNTSLLGASSYHGGWLFSEATAVADSTQESDAAQGRGITMTQKRPYMGESSQAPNKKQCMTGASKSFPSSSKPKPASSASKDPQSVAAKNRRERISERLKILQDLVPNGNKVDLVSMLEKAISYVKFLQLQVKVLATDEFWPAQGGKAPDIAQVKEAIDAILSHHRDPRRVQAPSDLFRNNR